MQILIIPILFYLVIQLKRKLIELEYFLEDKTSELESRVYNLERGANGKN